MYSKKNSTYLTTNKKYYCIKKNNSIKNRKYYAKDFVLYGYYLI